ncbi:hypothetical protein AAHA92_26561 [Salvia divinorum]|uniref:SANT domain-containing protein n=1 Tax=Salvia divinorum TaxID=28513 RepID=A0ABD1GEB5_SALDI
MPPEQLPWDRRDFRKHERSGSDPRFGGGGFGGGGPHRWREQNHHPHAPPPHPTPYHHGHNQNHQQQQRWYSDFRSRPIPPGHGKQGGWHMYPEDAGPGFMPFGSRYGERNIEDDNFRPFGNRGDGRYFRNSRGNRGASFNQRDWKSTSWEPAASSGASGPGRPTSEVNTQKFVENAETCHDSNNKSNGSCHPPPDPLPSPSPPPVKENNEKNEDGGDEPASSDQKSEKENGLGSIDWKPLKWNRSGSLSSRGSGLSHSSSSKSMGADSEVIVDAQQKNVTPVQSPAAVCAVPAAPAVSDETSSRKKPRLGWGEGLAKYEKKKVEGPEDVVIKDGLTVCVSDIEVMQFPSINMLDKSPRVASFSDCTESATPTSVACSSSPGIEEKESAKAVNMDHDTANWSCSPSAMSHAQYDGPAFNLENLDLTSIAHLSSQINELLQSDEPRSVETGYVRSTSMNKLLVWKVNILKAIEVTESEIDSLETELRSLVVNGPHPTDSSLLPGECRLKPCEQMLDGSSFTIGPGSLRVDSSGATNFENVAAALEDDHMAVKDEEIDSPGSATSKLVEKLPSGEDTFASEPRHCDEGNKRLEFGSVRSSEQCLEDGPGNHDETCCTDDHKLIETSHRGLSCGGDTHSDVDRIYDSILSSNKNSVNTAMDELNKLLPVQQSFLDFSSLLSASSLQSDPLVIKDKFLKKKRSLKFREKIVTLKFKVFQHFWNEGRVVSIRKLRGKSHKKFDLSHTGFRKYRSANRARMSYPGGCPRTVPAEEVIDYTTRLLSESPFKPCRAALKMPALILDKETRMSRFITNNALVEDPCSVEKEKSMINPWTAEERELFIDKLAIFGKNFGKIASFLEHKTIADCIEFYYKNHKSESFERARKKPEFAKQKKSQSNTYLVGSGKRWNREVNAASLDMLGEASMIAASVNDGVETQQRSASRIGFGPSSSHKVPRGEAPLQRSNSLDMYNNETVAADVLAGICASLSSEAMSSCITSSVDLIDGYQDWKCQRVGFCVKRPLTPDVTQNVDDECSDESCGEMDSTDWTDEEKSAFVQALSSCGKDFAMISQYVRTRSREQCKIFFSKARKCLGLDKIRPGVGTGVSDAGHGGNSDTEGACVVQTCSVTENDSSDCRMEEDLPHVDVKLSNESDVAVKHNLKPDSSGCVGNEGPCPLDSMDVEPVGKSLSTGNASKNDNPAIDVNVDGETHDSANHASGRKSEVTMLAEFSKSNSIGINKGDNSGQPNILSEADSKAVAEISNGPQGKDNERKRPILTEGNVECEKVQDKSASSTEVTSVSSALNETTESYPQVVRNISHPSVNAHSLMQIKMEADPQTCSEISRPISVEQSDHFASMESSTLFSVPIKYQRHSSTSALSNVASNGISEKDPKRSVRTVNGQQQHISGYLQPDTDKFSQVLRGYPVSVQTVKETNGDVNCKKHVPVHNISKRDDKFHTDRRREFSLQKCATGPKHQAEVQAPYPTQDKSRDHSRPRSGSSSDAEKPSRNGDVKLFGKILTSAQQNLDSCAEREGSEDQHNKPVCQTLNLRFRGDLKATNLDSSCSKFDCNNYMVSDNSSRSFSFWDGNRTNTGFAPLPDSALLLAKYPAAFSNHPMPPVKLDQPTLQGVIRSNDHSLNGLSVFPSRDPGSSNGVADYQVIRNRELSPFALDMEQKQDALLSEMQRRNGFDVVSGMQQQSRGVVGVGINVVGRGGILGQCSGVTDPVAAIKMHYAKAQNLGMQTGSGVREDDAWTSNGDVGK